MRINQHELGSILYTQGKKHICEGGVCDNKKSILWDEVDVLFLEASRTTVFAIPASEAVKVHIISTTKNKISFVAAAASWMVGKDKSSLWALYRFIVSEVIDRQWSKLVSDIEKGKRVTFGQFDIASSAIYRQKFFGGHDIIDFNRIVGCDYANAQLAIDFVNDKGLVERKSLGYVSVIPNIHLAQAFLSSIARQNSGQ
jgi:hypothetical protein